MGAALPSSAMDQEAHDAAMSAASCTIESRDYTRRDKVCATILAVAVFMSILAVTTASLAWANGRNLQDLGNGNREILVYLCRSVPNSPMPLPAECKP